MSANSKIVWSEGLFLRPQHLQQQDRFLERYVETRCQALRSYSWGLTEIEIERDLLAVGKLGLRRASGVFPDGTPFRMPDDEPLPSPLEVGPQLRDQVIHLAIPRRRMGVLDAARGDTQDGLLRYRIDELDTRDATSTAASMALLEVASLRSRLISDREPAEDYARIPIAQVVECRADKKVVLEDRFVPTVLDSRAALPLQTFLTELVGLLHQRGEALAGRVVATGRGASAEIADYLMLQVINRYEPLIAHLADAGLIHPEDFYRLCLQMAGELATFTSTTKRRPNVAGYRHERLRESFEPVIAALRASLSAVLEQSAIPIPIEPKKFGISVATTADRSLFSSAVFILAARADVPAEELRRRFPAQLKIGPVEKIRDLVNLQLPGVPVQPMPAAPRQIPYHAGYVYFELDQSHELWGQLKTSGGIALHVSGEFPGLGMELWAVRG
ncbi:MAG TPA: type VI secretion system baseplate subunit TssK [Steroidobacteraceae bacterium]|nr:type VI secretion system baseplate subunit TssK [Steroidobacteraceae bacterium]